MTTSALASPGRGSRVSGMPSSAYQNDMPPLMVPVVSRGPPGPLMPLLMARDVTGRRRNAGGVATRVAGVIDVPVGLVESQHAYAGEAGRAFVAALPARVDEFLERWEL